MTCSTPPASADPHPRSGCLGCRRERTKLVQLQSESRCDHSNTGVGTVVRTPSNSFHSHCQHVIVTNLLTPSCVALVSLQGILGLADVGFWRRRRSKAVVRAQICSTTGLLCSGCVHGKYPRRCVSGTSFAAPFHPSCTTWGLFSLTASPAQSRRRYSTDWSNGC